MIFSKKNGQMLFLIISILNLLFFTFTLSLLRPIWFDINVKLDKVFGINISWSLIVLIISTLILYYLIFILTKKIIYIVKNPTGETPRKHIIIHATIYTVWTLLLYISFNVLENKIPLLVYAFNDISNALILLTLLVVIVIVLPLYNFWKNTKIRIGLLMFVLLLFVLVTFDVGKPKLLVGPYLQAPTENSMTVMWITDSPCVAWVEYGLPGNLDQVKYSINNGLIDATETIHKIELDNLEKGTEYEYRIVYRKVRDIFHTSTSIGKPIYGDVYSFSTFDTSKENIKFLVISDIHDSPELLYDFSNNYDLSTFDFIVYLGDAFNTVINQEHIINSLLGPATDLFASNIPFIFVRGNHETRGPFARDFDKFIDGPGDNYYYTFNHGSASFLVLDTGEDKPDDALEYSYLNNFEEYRLLEYDWIEEVITTDSYLDATHRIAFSHIPLNEFLVRDDPEKITDYQESWVELLNQGNLNLLISGHRHFEQYYDQNDIIEFPILCTGGSIYLNVDGYQLTTVEVSSTSIITINYTIDGEDHATHTILK